MLNAAILGFIATDEACSGSEPILSFPCALARISKQALKQSFSSSEMLACRSVLLARA